MWCCDTAISHVPPCLPRRCHACFSACGSEESGFHLLQAPAHLRAQQQGIRSATGCPLPTVHPEQASWELAPLVCFLVLQCGGRNSLNLKKDEWVLSRPNESGLALCFVGAQFSSYANGLQGEVPQVCPFLSTPQGSACIQFLVCPFRSTLYTYRNVCISDAYVRHIFFCTLLSSNDDHFIYHNEVTIPLHKNTKSSLFVLRTV